MKIAELDKQAVESLLAKGQRKRNRYTGPIVVADGMKSCCRCKEEKSLAEFTKNRATVDGLDKNCKSCKKEIRNATRDYHRAKSKEWRETNPDRFKEKRDAWMQAHPQAQSEKRQKWLEENKHRVRQIKKAYKVRRQGWEVGEVDYDEILARDGLFCHICGSDVEPDDVHFDHVIPLSKGGEHSMDNIHVSHSRCNMKKNNRVLTEKVTATIKAG